MTTSSHCFLVSHLLIFPWEPMVCCPFLPFLGSCICSILPSWTFYFKNTQNSLCKSTVPAFAQVGLQQRRSVEQVKPLSLLRMSVAKLWTLVNLQWFMSTNLRDDYAHQSLYGFVFASVLSVSITWAVSEVFLRGNVQHPWHIATEVTTSSVPDNFICTSVGYVSAGECEWSSGSW